MLVIKYPRNPRKRSPLFKLEKKSDNGIIIKTTSTRTVRYQQEIPERNSFEKRIPKKL